MLKQVYIPKEDYNVFVGWFHYITNDGVEIYKNQKIAKKYYSLSEAIRKLSTYNEQYFIRKMYWKYEKEFRIVVRFNKDIPYDRIAIRFPIKKIEKGISIKYGPEISDEELVELSNEFQEYGIVNIDRFKSAKIQMNLVERNRSLLKE